MFCCVLLKIIIFFPFSYIRRLRNNEATISSLEYQPVRSTPLVPPAQPSQWIDEKCIPDEMTTTEALYHLRDVLLNDAFKISNVLNPHTVL